MGFLCISPMVWARTLGRAVQLSATSTGIMLFSQHSETVACQPRIFSWEECQGKLVSELQLARQTEQQIKQQFGRRGGPHSEDLVQLARQKQSIKKFLKTKTCPFAMQKE